MGEKSIGVVCRTETEDRCKKDGDFEYPLRYLLLSVRKGGMALSPLYRGQHS